MQGDITNEVAPGVSALGVSGCSLRQRKMVEVAVQANDANQCPSCGHQIKPVKVEDSGETSGLDRIQALSTYNDAFTPKAYVNVSTFKKYVAAMRPWSFSASFVPSLLGGTLAYKATGDVSLLVLLATCVATVSVHAAGNLVNTYMDYVTGVDSSSSEDRTLVDRILTPQQVLWLGTVTYCSACGAYLILSYLSPAPYRHTALLFFGGLSSSFLYTGGFGLKYVAFGDIVIILAFGPLTVMFSFLAQTGQLSVGPILYALPLVLNTEAILHSNNARDRLSDKQAGIVTLAILLGPILNYLLFVFLLFSPYVCLFVAALNHTKWFFLPIVTIRFAFDLERNFRRGNLTEMPQATAKLNLLLGVLFVVSCFLTNSAYLPGIAL